jgi:hypothetical protein
VKYPLELAASASPVCSETHAPANIHTPSTYPGPAKKLRGADDSGADLPAYAADQLREVAHRQKCTQPALLMKMMASHRDAEGRNIFHIRPEDLVADRLKQTRARG